MTMTTANALFEQLRQFDTPTICNALEVVRGARTISGFTRRGLIASRAGAHAIIGYARTAAIRSSAAAPDPAEQRGKRLAYYEYIAQQPQPSIAVVQDIDSLVGVGAFWGEVNTHVHWGLGCIGAVTNGSMRDLDAMRPEFQCLAGMLSPSHAFVHLVDFGKPVDVFGMSVSDGDIVHADRHGAVAIRPGELEKLPAAIDLMARREKCVLDAAKQAGFNVDKLRAAFAAMDQVKQ
jgi:regulator of RNase E activity RraA